MMSPSVHERRVFGRQARRESASSGTYMNVREPRSGRATKHGARRRRRLPAFGLDVVDVGMLALPYRLHDLADVDAVFDDGVADRHVFQRHLVTDRDVLPAFQL